MSVDTSRRNSRLRFSIGEKDEKSKQSTENKKTSNRSEMNIESVSIEETTEKLEIPTSTDKTSDRSEMPAEGIPIINTIERLELPTEGISINKTNDESDVQTEGQVFDNVDQKNTDTSSKDQSQNNAIKTHSKIYNLQNANLNKNRKTSDRQEGVLKDKIKLCPKSSFVSEHKWKASNTRKRSQKLRNMSDKNTPVFRKNSIGVEKTENKQNSDQEKDKEPSQKILT